jgi:hypothetical protein
VSQLFSLPAASLWHLDLYLQYVTVAHSSLVFLIRRAGMLIAGQMLRMRASLRSPYCEIAAKRLDNKY